ncbi:MAG: CotH kinase family protein [Acidobacteria bacterium]|nr:CotH kinase family protein [Acidobacteriota bacterium]
MTRFLVCLLAPMALFGQTAPSHVIWDTDQIHTVRLTFTDPDWYNKLRANFEGKDDPDYMEVDVEIGDRQFPRSGIRFKGNSSYNSYPGGKKSFKVKFDKYVKNTTYDGISTINLNNAFKDPSFVREKVYYELANSLGLAAPRVSYAALSINGEYWGLYFLTEQVDKTMFTGRFGAEEDGNLFKGDPRGTLEYRGQDKAPYKENYELETNEKADDWSDLIEFIRVLNTTPPADLPGAVEPLLDVEAVLSWLALDNYTVNLDSYIGSGHNYYLYHRLSDNRFTPIPWDPNEAWGVFNMGRSIDQLARLNRIFPEPPMPGRPLVTRLLSIPAYRERYMEKLKLMAEGAGHPDLLAARMNQLRDLIRDAVREDTKKMFTNQQFEEAMTVTVGQTPGPGQPPQPPGGGIPGGAIPGLETFLRARFTFLSQ